MFILTLFFLLSFAYNLIYMNVSSFFGILPSLFNYYLFPIFFVSYLTYVTPGLTHSY